MPRTLSENCQRRIQKSRKIKRNSEGERIPTWGTYGQVGREQAYKTCGGLTRSNLIQNKRGKWVSRKRHEHGQNSVRYLQGWNAMVAKHIKKARKRQEKIDLQKILYTSSDQWNQLTKLGQGVTGCVFSPPVCGPFKGNHNYVMKVFFSGEDAETELKDAEQMRTIDREANLYLLPVHGCSVSHVYSNFLKSKCNIHYSLPYALVIPKATPWRKWVERKRQPKRVLQGLFAVAHLLKRLHGLGYIHGDFHAEQVVMIPKGTPRLIDVQITPLTRNRAETEARNLVMMIEDESIALSMNPPWIDKKEWYFPRETVTLDEVIAHLEKLLQSTS